jgi:hypothetical protein
MARHDDRSFLQKIYELGEKRLNVLAEEVLSNPRFAEILGGTVQKAMETKGRVDRNMQTLLGLLNLPSRADYRKLATKIEALQGSLVNLNIKLDRILAGQHVAGQHAEGAKRRKAKAAKPHRHDEAATGS